MLPQEVARLARNLIEVFDSEHGLEIEFRKARNSVLNGAAAKGRGWRGSANLVQINRKALEFVEERTAFIWEKLQESVNANEIPFYHALSDDLFAELTSHVQPSIQKAERFFEDTRREFNAPSGYTMEDTHRLR